MPRKSKSHPGKVLHLFAEIQEHLHNGVIHHELSQIARRVWNKLRYNCQHWATHMFDNNPRCPDLDKIKDERKKEKEKTGVYRFKGSELETQN